MIPSLMFPPGPTALPTRPNVEVSTDMAEILPVTTFTVVTGSPEKQPTMVPAAQATEATTVGQPPSQTAVAETSEAEAKEAEATQAEARMAETTVAESIVPVVSTVAGTAHLVTDPPVAETAAPATAAGDVEPVQTAAAEAKPNDKVTEGRTDEVNGKKYVGLGGKVERRPLKAIVE